MQKIKQPRPWKAQALVTTGGWTLSFARVSIVRGESRLRGIQEGLSAGTSGKQQQLKWINTWTIFDMFNNLKWYAYFVVKAIKEKLTGMGKKMGDASQHHLISEIHMKTKHMLTAESF